MDAKKKRRSSLLKSVFGPYSSTPVASAISPDKKVRAEIGLTNTTLRMVSSPDTPKPTFAVFQTRMLKIVDAKHAGTQNRLNLRYVPVEIPKPPPPTIKVTKADGIPFTLKTEGAYPIIEERIVESEISVDSDRVREWESLDTTVPVPSIVPTMPLTPPESPAEDRTVVGEDSLSSGLQGQTKIRPLFRRNTISRRNATHTQFDTMADSAAEDGSSRQAYFRFDPSSQRAPSPPLTTPLTFPSAVPATGLPNIPAVSAIANKTHSVRRKEIPDAKIASLQEINGSSNMIEHSSVPRSKPVIKLNTSTSSPIHAIQKEAELQATEAPGPMIEAAIHPSLRHHEENLQSPPISPPDEGGPNVIDDVSSVSSLDSFSSTSSFSTAINSVPLSEEDNADSIVANRDSYSTYRDSWITCWSVDNEDAKQRKREIDEARLARIKAIAKDLVERRGGGAGTLKWGGMDIGEVAWGT